MITPFTVHFLIKQQRNKRPVSNAHEVFPFQASYMILSKVASLSLRCLICKMLIKYEEYMKQLV